MDRQLAFLMHWQAILSPMVEYVSECSDCLTEEQMQIQLNWLFENSEKAAREFEPASIGHDYLVELVITACHYVNLLYQAGAFDDDDQ